MHTERLGRYEVRLSARQMIHNGGWAGFAAIHAVADAAREGAEATPPAQWLADETAVFASEAAAIAGARAAALAFLRSGDPPREV